MIKFFLLLPFLISCGPKVDIDELANKLKPDVKEIVKHIRLVCTPSSPLEFSYSEHSECMNSPEFITYIDFKTHVVRCRNIEIECEIVIVEEPIE